MEKLSDMTKDELLAVAEQFGADEVKKSDNKGEIIAKLAEDGIDDEFLAGSEDPNADDADVYGALEPAAPAAPVEEDDEDLVLVKMIRANNTYEIRGHVFKLAHPFALVKEADADYLIEVDGGFRLASPKEAREFYS
jgi:hypothetical protein